MIATSFFYFDIRCQLSVEIAKCVEAEVKERGLNPEEF